MKHLDYLPAIAMAVCEVYGRITEDNHYISASVEVTGGSLNMLVFKHPRPVGAPLDSKITISSRVPHDTDTKEAEKAICEFLTELAKIKRDSHEAL
jgi:hypothetical protein